MLRRVLEVPAEAQRLADEKDFELKAFAFGAAEEQARSPRLVRVGLVQNQILLPTTAPILEQACAQLLGTPSVGFTLPSLSAESGHCGAHQGHHSHCLSVWSQRDMLPGGFR